MKSVNIKTIEQHDNVSLYSICFNGCEVSEFETFMLKFKDNAQYKKDYDTIIMALEKIIEVGALERLFRREGSPSDHVAALSLDSRSLRLYCLRMSDEVLILGNGGVKTTRTYEESPELHGYVLDLQNFDKLLKDALKKGLIKIEKNLITNIETATFQI